MKFPEFITYCKLAGYENLNTNWMNIDCEDDCKIINVECDYIAIEFRYRIKDNTPSFLIAWIDDGDEFYSETSCNAAINKFLAAV